MNWIYIHTINHSTQDGDAELIWPPHQFFFETLQLFHLLFSDYENITNSAKEPIRAFHLEVTLKEIHCHNKTSAPVLAYEPFGVFLDIFRVLC